MHFSLIVSFMVAVVMAAPQGGQNMKRAAFPQSGTDVGAV
jgi:hypothetical protein